VRSTTFIFITLCTSVQILGENCAQRCLVRIVSAALQPRRDVVPARRRVRPRRAVPPTRAPRRAALLEAALSPRQRAFPRRARMPRAAGVRATACRAWTRAPGLARASRVPLGLCPWPALLSPLALLSVARWSPSHYKKAPQGELLACLPSTARAAPPTPLEVAAASLGFRLAVHPTKTPSTFPCTYYSSPAHPFFPWSCYLAGAVLLAAAAS
jgi:hypothetical protein